MADYVIGVDYGTDSVRAVITDCADGKELGASVFPYPRWAAGKYCDPATNRFRQHPRDYVEGLEASVKGALAAAPAGTAAKVRAISVDTTGSTPCAVDASGSPLSLRPEFAEDPDAMFVLWKDHTGVAEADEINKRARGWGGEDYTRFEGGIYSSEWFWAKILHVARANAKVAAAAHSWIEHCDWIPAVLAGLGSADAIPRGRCASGHKALWHESWGGLPPEAFFKGLDPILLPYVRNMPAATMTADKAVGRLCEDWAARLGLSEGIAIGAGAFDAHMGAVGVGVKPGWLIRIMGTSTCDIMVADRKAIGDRQVKGICGQVDGSVIPGMVGLEAGQSAFGDLYAWFAGLLAWPSRNAGPGGADAAKGLIPALEAAAKDTPFSDANPIFVDWLNGRRTPDADQSLQGAFLGLSLGSDAPRLYRAVVEGSAFGSKAIVERFAQEGVKIEGIIGTGGVAKKSAFAMQVLSDVLEMPIRVAASDQGCALGASIFASVVAGVYTDVPAAQAAMASVVDAEYKPDPSKAAVYRSLYARYKAAGAFIEKGRGGVSAAKDPYGELKARVYEANLEIPRRNLAIYTFGNASGLDASKAVFAIKPSGVPYEELRAADMVVMDLDGKVVEGEMRASSDAPTHAYLYRHFPGIGGIVHTHSTQATSWAQARRSIPIYGTTHADHLAVDVPCAAIMSDAAVAGDYEVETGKQIVATFKEAGLDPLEVPMVLVAGHGPFTWGKDPAKAIYHAAVLEQLAEMAALTEGIKPGAERLPGSIIRKHYERKHGPGAYYGQAGKP